MISAAAIMAAIGKTAKGGSASHGKYGCASSLLQDEQGEAVWEGSSVRPLRNLPFASDIISIFPERLLVFTGPCYRRL